MQTNNEPSDISDCYLQNGIWALALAGIYSVVLVVLRTPVISAMFADKSIFKSSLIIHVNLSVLVWLLSMVCMIWSTGKRIIFDRFLCRVALGGMLLMAISPFIGEGNPVMNNYVPILENIWFIVGLSLFGCSVLCFAVLTLIQSKNDIIKTTSSCMYMLTWICFALSYRELSILREIVPMDVSYYYEMLFWSGGHYLQFIYTQIVMFAWLVLAEKWVGQKLRYHRIYKILFAANFLLSTLIFYGHYEYQMPDYEFKEFFTTHMRYCGGVIPAMFCIVLMVDTYNYLRANERHFCFSATALIASGLMFGVGGMIGSLISGVNVSIPAHYHGSIVGISIAFMGTAYIRCYHNYTPGKWPEIQLWVITIGQLLHIAGLGFAGGYGILRKDPDGEIAASAKIYMAMVGGGGLVAIIGGLMFVFICARVMAFKTYKYKR